ncbi:MAG: MFS transporter [Rickettsiales bacterium]|nr:MFS transporter [Rickettsiales bacterium]
MLLNLKSARNFIIIFFLGIASGLPLALIISTLKVLLLEQGFDIKTIGFFALISIPYSFKFCYAPIIDSVKIPFLSNKVGQRKSWILFMQVCLALFIALLGWSGVMGSLFLIGLFALMVAFFSASQDIVIDGYRIELIQKDDQGLAASFYVYGYRIGMLISGAGALALAEILYWDAVYFIMSCCMGATILIMFFAEETRKNFTIEKNFSDWFSVYVIDPFVDFSKHRKWFLILIFVILFKLSDAFAGNLTLPFLREIGFSKIEIASIVKTFGLFATLFGVFVGGVLVKKYSIYNTLWIAVVAQMLSNLAFCYLAKIGYDTHSLYWVIFIENFSGGIGDAVFVAYLSSLCNINYSATQYALLVSCATFSRSVLTSLSGVVVTDFGWYNFFIISALLSIPSLFLLLCIRQRVSTQ